ncbi:hypothetical protein BC936DRAFT_139344 [Jimgerdemannia flammicorona]|uniref:Uncharacterized protein n=1 Tax=Jimgerdemannia flammicorona TaxID=994334 RepID=A0A433BA22_9FUNG|nr:hypothetical protein BC936DRAFT_139344 [Jimgerdemannia flammicorona]
MRLMTWHCESNGKGICPNSSLLYHTRMIWSAISLKKNLRNDVFV